MRTPVPKEKQHVVHRNIENIFALFDDQHNYVVWRSVLEDELGDYARHVMATLGHTVTKRYLDQLHAAAGSSPAAEQVLGLLTKQGFGTFTLSEGKPPVAGTVVIECRGCPEAAMVQNVRADITTCVCDYTAGVLSALYHGAFKNAYCVETACTALGDDYCVFVVGELAALRKGLLVNGESLLTPLQRLFHSHQAISEAYAKLEEQSKAHENTMRLMNKKLVEANAIKKARLANIIHEVRTPLHAIIGYSQLLLEDLRQQLSGEQIEDIKLITQHAHEILDIIRDFSEVGQISADETTLNLDFCEVKSLIQRVVNTFQPLAKRRGIELRTKVEDNMPFLYTDIHKLRQMVNNLVSNAIKFTNSGWVLVEVTHSKSDGASLCTIRVEDTGIGISSDAIKTIFDEFQQIDYTDTRKFQGTGIGLTIVKKVVDAFSGTIDVTSQVGKGTVFTVQFPCNLETRAHPSS